MRAFLDGSDVLEAGHRLLLKEPIRIGELGHEQEIPPPEGLVFAPVPGKKLGEEPAGVLLRGALQLVGGNAVGQAGGDGLYVGERASFLSAAWNRTGGASSRTSSDPETRV